MPGDDIRTASISCSQYTNSIGTEGVGNRTVHEVCGAWGGKMHFLIASELWLGVTKEL